MDNVSCFYQISIQKTDIPLQQINYGFINSFDKYLTPVWDCETNTKVKYLQHLKRITALAKNNGWIQADPFTNFKIKRKKAGRSKCMHKLTLVIFLILTFP